MAFNFTRPVFRTGTQPIMTRDMLRFSATVDLASLAAAASVTGTIAAVGAAVGDDVTIHVEVPTAGLVYIAWVSAADVVTYRVSNLTAGAIDETSRVYRVSVWKARSL